MSRLTEPSTKTAMRYHGHNTARRCCTHAEMRAPPCQRRMRPGADGSGCDTDRYRCEASASRRGVSPRASVAAYSSLKTGCAGAARMYSSSGAFADATVVSGAARDHQRVK